MKQITIQGFAYCKPAKSYETSNPNCIDGFTYDFIAFDPSEFSGNSVDYIHIGKATITIDAPDNFDPRAGAVQALEEQRKRIQAEFQARITEIDRQISQYTAIEYMEAA